MTSANTTDEPLRVEHRPGCDEREDQDGGRDDDDGLGLGAQRTRDPEREDREDRRVAGLIPFARPDRAITAISPPAGKVREGRS